MSFDPSAFRHRLRALLDGYAEAFGRRADDHAVLRGQIERGDDVHSRRTFPGHVTTSAIILDEAGRQTLLIRHRALGRWLQPGGHYEMPDELETSALREALEETGLSNLAVDPWHQSSGLPIDIDSHVIPARPERNEPEHWHHDVRYVVRARSADVLRPDLAEVEGAAWHGFDVLETFAPHTLRNLIRVGLVRASCVSPHTESP